MKLKNKKTPNIYKSGNTPKEVIFYLTAHVSDQIVRKFPQEYVTLMVFIPSFPPCRPLPQSRPSTVHDRLGSGLQVHVHDVILRKMRRTTNEAEKDKRKIGFSIICF